MLISIDILSIDKLELVNSLAEISRHLVRGCRTFNGQLTLGYSYFMISFFFFKRQVRFRLHMLSLRNHMGECVGNCTKH